MEQNARKKKKRAGKRGARLAVAAALLLLALFLGLAAGRELEKRTYRLLYPETIEKYAKAYELDSYLVAAMIHCESGNRSAAQSRVGAAGLMQIMPDTGEWIAGKLKLEDYTEDMLGDPDVNIRMGCWYLRFLLDRYQEDRPSALAAYNAGHGTVDKWKNDPKVSSEGQLVDIPYAETEKYVEKVQRAYEKYKSLYAGVF